MTQAANDNTITVFRVADLIEFDDEPRVIDTLLGERLEMAQPINLRAKIKDNLPELSLHGKIRSAPIPTTAKGGRPGIAYYLNEAQALLLCMFANTKVAARVRKLLIDVFMEYRRGKLSGGVLPAVQKDYAVPLAEARSAVEASIAKMERAVADIHAAASRPKCLSAMVVNGEPVVVDVSDFDTSDGSEAVVLLWDGSLEITTPNIVKQGGNRFGNDDVTREDGHVTYSTFLQHGARTGFTPFRKQGRLTVRDGCVILGKVIRSQPHVYADHEPAAAPTALAAPTPAVPERKRRKPMDHKTWQRVHFLYTSGYSNAEIAKNVGLPYWMIQKRTARLFKSRRLTA